MRTYEGSFPYIHRNLGYDLAHRGQQVAVPTWHAQKVEGNPMLVSYELGNVTFVTPLPDGLESAQVVTECQLPWAEDHFLERVGGVPLNPPPSADYWLKPGQADIHRTVIEGGISKYSHSYPERLWPSTSLKGIRFRYGDLGDVVDLLQREPLTRQAYLPIWYPEDTGAHHKHRVPCTLGYHFMIRENLLNITYMIRSVDYIRHFRDDVYMAMRLAQWMSEKVNDTQPPCQVGNLYMHIMSLHAFEGDMPKLRRQHGAD